MQDDELSHADAMVFDDDDMEAEAVVNKPGAGAPNVNLIDPELQDGDEFTRFPVEEVEAPSDGSIVIPGSVRSDNLDYWNRDSVIRDGFEIRAPKVSGAEEYIIFENPEVSEVLQRYENEDEVSYLVKLTDDRVEEVSSVSVHSLKFKQLQCPEP